MPRLNCNTIIAIGVTTMLLLVNGPAVFALDLHVPGEYPFIQAAIIAANDGDTIIIAPGIYIGNGNRDISFQNKAITVRSEDPNDPNMVMATIIDADGSIGNEHRGFVFESGEGATSILAGVTIVNGYATSGGGIRCINSSPTIRHCVIETSVSTGNGGGIYLEGSSAQILDCMIYNNSADSDGGGLFCLTSTIQIDRCAIYDNMAIGAQNQGGGIHCDNGTLSINRSRLFGNRGVFGGGVFCFDSSVVTLSHSEITGNTADGSGGGIYNQDSSVELELCTVSGNQALSGFGGGLRCFAEGSFSLENSILWNNVADLPGDGTGHEIALTPTNNEEVELTVGYSDLQGGQDALLSETDNGDVIITWLLGNIDIDPLFVAEGFFDDNGTPGDVDDDSWIEGDYHLLTTSLCIDAGDPGSDFDNEPQPNGDRVNMGAYGHTSEAALSIRSPITLTKGSFKADKKRVELPNLDGIKLSGLLYEMLGDADIADFLSADEVTVRIDVVDEEDFPRTNIALDTFAIEFDPIKTADKQTFIYKRPKEDLGAVKKFQVDYNKNTFAVDIDNTDLTGLRFPFKLEIAFGDYLGDIIVRNATDMAGKSDLPLCLLLGVSDEMEITKAKVKTANSGDALSAQGHITAAMGDLDLTQEEITVNWGDINPYSETIPAQNFEMIKAGRYRFKKEKDAVGTIQSLDIDFNKCTFKLSVKEAGPLDAEGIVTLEIAATSENLQAAGDFEFPVAE